MSERVSTDTIMHLTYHTDRDHYFLRAEGEPTDEIAYTPISPSGGFLIFDNHSQGRMVAAGYRANDEQSASIMCNLFGSEFKLYAASMRDGAQIYDSPERQTIMIVPYSNQRRLAMIAFHAIAINASKDVQELAARIETQMSDPTP